MFSVKIVCCVVKRRDELSYKPWGETRYASATTRTRVRFTGQHEESRLGG